MSTNKSMLLTSVTWEQEKYKSFKMIPITHEAPYTEAFYDPKAECLVILSKDKKETFTMLQELDRFGKPTFEKHGGETKAIVKRQRVDTYKEYYVSNPDEIRTIVNILAENAKTFDFEQFLNKLVLNTPEVDEIITNISEAEVSENEQATADLS